MGVDLGHHERHVVFHAEGAGVVDHDCTSVDHCLAHFLRNAGACAEQCDVHALKGFGGHFLDGKFTGRNLATALEGKLLAC